MEARLTFDQWKELGRQVRKGEKSERTKALVITDFLKLRHALEGIHIGETAAADIRPLVEKILNRAATPSATFAFAQTEHIGIHPVSFQRVPNLGAILEGL